MKPHLMRAPPAYVQSSHPRPPPRRKSQKLPWPALPAGPSFSLLLPPPSEWADLHVLEKLEKALLVCWLYGVVLRMEF